MLFLTMAGLASNRDIMNLMAVHLMEDMVLALASI